MNNSTTIAVNGRVYEMGTAERAQEAAEWMYNHPDEFAQFEDHFQDAQPVATPLGSTLRQQ